MGFCQIVYLTEKSAKPNSSVFQGKTKN